MEASPGLRPSQAPPTIISYHQVRSRVNVNRNQDRETVPTQHARRPSVAEGKVEEEISRWTLPVELRAASSQVDVEEEESLEKSFQVGHRTRPERVGESDPVRAREVFGDGEKLPNGVVSEDLDMDDTFGLTLH